MVPEARQSTVPIDPAETAQILAQYLSNTVRVYTRNLVVATLLKYVMDIEQVKGLGFCVSIEHGEFINHYFNEHGISTLFLSGKSSE